MRVAIVGAGAIGGVLGGRLAARGHEVALVARGEHLAAIRRDGLRLVDHVGSASGSYRLPASDDPAAFGVQDLVVIAVKAHAIAAVLPRLRTLLNDDTVVVPAINGLPWWYFHGEPGPHQGRRLRTLDPAGTMFADLDCRHLLGCVVHVAAEVRAAGEVHHTGGRRLVLGEPDNSASGRLQRVCALLDDAGGQGVRRDGDGTEAAVAQVDQDQIRGAVAGHRQRIGDCVQDDGRVPAAALVGRAAQVARAGARRRQGVGQQAG